MRFTLVFRVVVYVAAIYGTTLIAPLAAQEKVAVQGWARESFGRIVFDWSRPVKYRAVINGSDLIVSFERQFSSDLKQLLITLKDYLVKGAVSGQGRVAKFGLKGKFQLRTYPRGNSIIIDLRRLGVNEIEANRPVLPKPEARPSINVRVGSNKGFTRFVFDWNRKINYRVRSLPTKVSLSFDQEATIDLPKLKKRLPSGITNPVALNLAGRLEFSVEKTPNRASRSFRAGNRIVLDIYDPKTPAKKSVKRISPSKINRVEPRKKEKVSNVNSGKKTTESANVSGSSTKYKSEESKGLLLSKPEPIDKKSIRKATGVKPLARPKKQHENTAKKSKIGQNSTIAAAANDKADSVVLPGANADVKARVAPDIKPLAAPTPKVEKLPKLLPSPAVKVDSKSSPSVNPKADKEAVQITPSKLLAQKRAEGPSRSSVKSSGKANRVDNEPVSKSVSLVFGWPESVGAAVFRRGDFIWVVFDREKPLELESLRSAGKSLVSDIVQLPATEATVLRLKTKEGINPKVSQIGTNWEVSFGRWPITPDIPIPLDFTADEGGGAQLLFAGVAADSIVTIKDPDIGDSIKVAPMAAPGRGIGEKHIYPEFQVLPSSQGVALIPLSDRLRMQNARGKGILLAASGGLFVSAISPEENRTRNDPLLGERLFEPQVWINGGEADFIPERQAALLSVVEVPEEQREQARLNLARFYFARGLGPEALGILRVLERANPKMTLRTEFIALRGASRVLSDRLVLARKDLDNPRLIKFREAKLWRGFLNAKRGEWKQASADFRNSDTVLRTYPEPLKTIIGLERIEAALRSFNSESAKDWVDLVKQNKKNMRRDHKARLQYSLGLLARANGDLDGAEAFWRQSRDSGDPFSGARSELALINLGMKQEIVTRDQAIDRLERLRYRWRGDELELNVLETLGNHYLEKGEYSKGLLRLRVAMSYFPENKRTVDIAKRMTKTFRKLFLDGEADKLQPLTSLAIFDEYRELTPAGPDGDFMIGRLADRLVDVDLLDRATDLLSHHIRFRLKGVKKSEAGTKLALVHLINQKPREALRTLRSTFSPGLSQNNQDDRRRIRAKAMFELGKNEEAIALLAGDVSIAADQLRADIYWRGKNYREAGKVLQRLAGEPLTTDRYDLKGAQRVLNWAVAMRLDEDEQGLKLARELYGPAMKNSPLGDSFSYIASPRQTVTGDMEGISKKITEIDNFEAFLNNYRKRLLKSESKKK